MTNQTQPVRITANTKHTNNSRKSNGLITSAISLLILLAVSAVAKGQDTSLGAAADFTVISQDTITNTGPTIITGSVALSPGTSITGFPPGTVTGSIHINDAAAELARLDALHTFTDLALLPSDYNLTGQNLGGKVLTPGVYYFASTADLTGTLTLDTQSNPNARFVFQIGSALTTAAASHVILTGAGAGIDPNVFWVVGSSATLGTDTDFLGNVGAMVSVTLNTRASVELGRVIALGGAVTLDSNVISTEAVPEPATWAMMVFGSIGVLSFWRRKLCYANA